MRLVSKLVRSGAVAAIVTASGAGMAMAQEVEPTFSTNVAFTSDYVFRGITQSDSDPALQAGFDVGLGMVYGGVWASSIDFGLDESLEMDFYAGIKPQIGPVTLDLGLIYYAYPGLDSDVNGDMTELKVAGSMSPMKGLTVGAGAYYTTRFTFSQNSADGLYYEGSAAYAINDSFGVSGAVGRQEVNTDNFFVDANGDGTDSYTAWNLGGTYTYKTLAFDLRYWDTDLDDVDLVGPGGDSSADGRVVLTAKRTF